MDLIVAERRRDIIAGPDDVPHQPPHRSIEHFEMTFHCLRSNIRMTFASALCLLDFTAADHNYRASHKFTKPLLELLSQTGLI